MAHLELTQDNIPTTGKNLQGQEWWVFTLPASQRAFGPSLSQVGKRGRAAGPTALGGREEGQAEVHLRVHLGSHHCQ